MSNTTIIRDWLASQRGRWPEIAEATGVKYWTICSFVQQRTKTLRSNNLDALDMQRRREARRRKSPKVSAA